MLNILLAYVSYPITTAAYWERALRKIANVKTIGPKLPEHLIKSWNLEMMPSKVMQHDIDVPMDFNMENLPQFLGSFKPDLYLWVESVPGYFPKNLNHLQCIKACYLIDLYSNSDWHLTWAKNFDFVFLADLSYVDRFRKEGINAFWLPLGCDPEIHIPQTLNLEYEIGFVGTVVKGSERQRYLEQLAKNYNVHYERSFLRDMATTFSKSKIVFNNAVGKSDLNMRFFEAMSCGALLLSDMAINSGQDILFEPQYDYALYDHTNITDVAGYYLNNESARQAVAKRGQEIALAAHTYDHRVEHLLEVINKKLTRTYTPQEWRDIANSKVKKAEKTASRYPFANLIDKNSISRSFIIPVLDYSPASPYNIKTLLDDLSQIGGEVIVIFNNEKIAHEIKNHPRIDYYAVLNENIGVSRAWNVGIQICQTEYAFILNADLKIGPKTVELMHEALKTLPKAAIVGPQGAYFNFDTLKDYLYLDKGSFPAIMEVDAVSGFLFAIDTKAFKNKGLQFENQFTPCYFEEWDLGLQIKAAGLKSYAIPLKDYAHEWSGSIRSYREIKYYDRSQTAKQIQMRNATIFHDKWKNCDEVKKDPSFLRSIWFGVLVNQFNIALKGNHRDHVKNYLTQLERLFPNESELKKCQQMFRAIL